MREPPHEARARAPLPLRKAHRRVARGRSLRKSARARRRESSPVQRSCVAKPFFARWRGTGAPCKPRAGRAAKTSVTSAASLAMKRLEAFDLLLSTTLVVHTETVSARGAPAPVVRQSESSGGLKGKQRAAGQRDRSIAASHVASLQRQRVYMYARVLRPCARSPFTLEDSHQACRGKCPRSIFAPAT